MKTVNFAVKALASFFVVLRKNPVAAVAVAVLALLAYMVQIAAGAISTSPSHFMMLTGLIGMAVMASIAVLLIVKKPAPAPRRK